jgi:hypothetical protein
MKPAICSKCGKAHGGFVPDDAEDIVCFACANPPPAIFISGCCEGERCSMCGDAAAHKVAEEIQYDDPNPIRHGLTAYVCHDCFTEIMGAAAGSGAPR